MTQAAHYMAEACRLYIIIVLTCSAAAKAGAMESFRDTIGELFHLPRAWVRHAARATIAVEGSIALGLLAGGILARAGMAAALALFAVFTIVILIALLQRRAVDCNCFGRSNHMISATDIVRNTLLMAACGVYLAPGLPDASLALTAYPPLIGVALIAFLITIHLNEIARIAR